MFSVGDRVRFTHANINLCDLTGVVVECEFLNVGESMVKVDVPPVWWDGDEVIALGAELELDA